MSRPAGQGACVCVHGMGGTPATMAPIADGLASAGFAVASPLLPGHGTEPADLAAFGWDDWLGRVREAVMGAGGPVAVVGQSVGATIGLALAAELPEVVVGAVCINPVATPSDPDVVEYLTGVLERGKTMLPVGAPDIRDPDVTEDAYDQLPIQALLEQARGVDLLNAALQQGRVRTPVLIATSVQDAVTDPANSEHLAALLGGRARRLMLERSGHVASLDVERDLLTGEIVGFLGGVAAFGGNTGFSR